MADIISKVRKEARKFYFAGKLNEFLSKLLEKEENEEILGDLKVYLAGLRKEEKEILKEFEEFLPTKKDLPSIEELFKNNNQQQLDKWEETVQESMNTCIRLAREQRDKISEGKPVDSRKLLDLGLFFISNEFSFNQLFAYRERMYKVKIIKIIDEYGVSRREAQDRAEITDEYFKYNIVKRNLETLKELSTYAKKYQSSF
jgi:hypothetical protein